MQLPAIADDGKTWIIQLSMDGPNVNLRTLELLVEKAEADATHGLLEVGSCGLHILGNAFHQCDFFGTFGKSLVGLVGDSIIGETNHHAEVARSPATSMFSP